MLKELDIETMIYEIRGKQVMLDSDLAKLFNYETKNLNRQVQRNVNRFPSNYCFQLTDNEMNDLRCQNGTSNQANYGGRRYLPYVFTEHGITMLAGILKSSVAIEMSIRIVNAFVEMRHYISNNLIEQKYVNNLVFKHEEDIKLLQSTFDSFKEKNNHIFFEGQIYDAYSLLLDIFNQAKEEIIIIDNYVDKKLLDVLSKIDNKIIIYSNNYNQELINKYNKEYTNVICRYTNKFHDRFIIIDNIILYHSGASFKDLGNKCFALNKIEDKKYLKSILEELC